MKKKTRLEFLSFSRRRPNHIPPSLWKLIKFSQFPKNLLNLFTFKGESVIKDRDERKEDSNWNRMIMSPEKMKIKFSVVHIYIYMYTFESRFFISSRLLSKNIEISWKIIASIPLSLSPLFWNAKYVKVLFYPEKSRQISSLRYQWIFRAIIFNATNTRRI